jgi:hypothetical protein
MCEVSVSAHAAQPHSCIKCPDTLSLQAERLVARSAAADADAADLRRQLGLAREAGAELAQRSGALLRTANGLVRLNRLCCQPVQQLSKGRKLQPGSRSGLRC